MMAYIHCDQKPNGVIYASLYESFRDKGKVKTRRMENLGRVIDKQNSIFCQKSITYQYVLGEGRKEVPPSALPSEPVVPETEKLILDFGDAWFLQEYLSRQPFYGSIQNTLLDERDTLLALAFYRLLTNKGANLTSQNISRVLKELGREEIQRRFFEEYMYSIYGDDGAAGILVDSTGVPNATRMDIILPMYYTRQQVEQVFDISKNYADLLPIRVQSE